MNFSYKSRSCLHFQPSSLSGLAKATFELILFGKLGYRIIWYESGSSLDFPALGLTHVYSLNCIYFLVVWSLLHLTWNSTFAAIRSNDHHHRAWHHGGGVPVCRAQPVPEAHRQNDHQRCSAAAQAAGQEHLQLGGDGESEGHGGSGAVFSPADLQEHPGLHPLWGGGGKQNRGKEPVDPSGWKNHKTQRVYWCPQGKADTFGLNKGLLCYFCSVFSTFAHKAVLWCSVCNSEIWKTWYFDKPTVTATKV